VLNNKFGAFVQLIEGYDFGLIEITPEQFERSKLNFINSGLRAKLIQASYHRKRAGEDIINLFSSWISDRINRVVAIFEFLQRSLDSHLGLGNCSRKLLRGSPDSWTIISGRVN
jgi:hypothetical protein